MEEHDEHRGDAAVDRQDLDTRGRCVAQWRQGAACAAARDGQLFCDACATDAAWCCASRKRSASIAAMQPVPAAVTAWRYVRSWTSPQAKTPRTLVSVELFLVTM